MPTEQAIALETRNLTRTVPGKVLVEDISVEVRKGEMLAIVGPRGSGKSSFLRLLNRLDEPTAGTVLLDGHGYHGLAPQELRRRVGVVMQMAYLFPGTVAANIAFGRFSSRRPLRPIGLRRCSIAWTGLTSGSRRQQFVEAQRVSLARTLANDPEALLLDEPTSALSPLPVSPRWSPFCLSAVKPSRRLGSLCSGVERLGKASGETQRAGDLNVRLFFL